MTLSMMHNILYPSVYHDFLAVEIIMEIRSDQQ